MEPVDDVHSIQGRPEKPLLSIYHVMTILQGKMKRISPKYLEGSRQ